jgi:hypothetical protein
MLFVYSVDAAFLKVFLSGCGNEIFRLCFTYLKRLSKLEIKQYLPQKNRRPKKLIVITAHFLNHLQ